MRHLRFHTDRDVHSQAFRLQRVQPALSGLMDGSLSTLAPIFAVVLATHRPLTAFFTGLATALGAGVSMAFSEGLSDTGDLTGQRRLPARARPEGAQRRRGGHRPGPQGHAGQVLPEISRYGGHVLQTSLNEEGERRLEEALSAGAAGGGQG